MTRMAKGPPTSIVKAQALAMLDRLESGWFETERDAVAELGAAIVEGAFRDEVLHRIPVWTTERDARAAELAAQIVARDALVSSGISEWLRWHPRKRSDGRLWTYRHEIHREAYGDGSLGDVTVSREVHYHCVICDHNHATLAAGKAPRQPLIDRMYLHGAKCAMRVLSWTTQPPKSVIKADVKREGTRQMRRARNAAIKTAQPDLFKKEAPDA